METTIKKDEFGDECIEIVQGNWTPLTVKIAGQSIIIRRRFQSLVQSLVVDKDEAIELHKCLGDMIKRLNDGTQR